MVFTKKVRLFLLFYDLKQKRESKQKKINIQMKKKIESLSKIENKLITHPNSETFRSNKDLRFINKMLILRMKERDYIRKRVNIEKYEI